MSNKENINIGNSGEYSCCICVAISYTNMIL